MSWPVAASLFAFIGTLLCGTAARSNDWVSGEGWYLFHEGKCLVGPNEMHSPFTFMEAVGTHKFIVTNDNDGRAEVMKVRASSNGETYEVTWYYGQELCYAFHGK